MTRNTLALVATILVGGMATAPKAEATSLRVKLACASDYYAYCSQHNSRSAEAKKCMRANGRRLSNRCISALIEDGHVSASYVAKRRALRKKKSFASAIPRRRR